MTSARLALPMGEISIGSLNEFETSQERPTHFLKYCHNIMYIGVMSCRVAVYFFSLFYAEVSLFILNFSIIRRNEDIRFSNITRFWLFQSWYYLYVSHSNEGTNPAAVFLWSYFMKPCLNIFRLLQLQDAIKVYCVLCLTWFHQFNVSIVSTHTAIFTSLKLNYQYLKFLLLWLTFYIVVVL